MKTQKKIISYKECIRGIDTLDINQQLDLMKVLSARIKNRIGERKIKKHSIMELEGLGSEIWKDIDAQKYVSEERESWD